MSTSEEPVDDSIAKHFCGAATEGAELVGTSADADPAVIVDAINRFLTKGKKGGSFSKADNWEDGAIPIGSLWGTAMVRQFGWRWASLTQHDHDDFQAIAVVSDDASFAIFPFHYCFGCLEYNATPTVLLVFNMLVAGEIPYDQPGEYANLMDQVSHIIPPD